MTQGFQTVSWETLKYDPWIWNGFLGKP
jgi:hypothetical protein